MSPKILHEIHMHQGYTSINSFAVEKNTVGVEGVVTSVLDNVLGKLHAYIYCSVQAAYEVCIILTV